MSAGDQKYLNSNRFLNSKRAVTNPTIKSAMENELKNSKNQKNNGTIIIYYRTSF